MIPSCRYPRGLTRSGSVILTSGKAVSVRLAEVRGSLVSGKRDRERREEITDDLSHDIRVADSNRLLVGIPAAFAGVHGVGRDREDFGEEFRFGKRFRDGW